MQLIRTAFYCCCCILSSAVVYLQAEEPAQTSFSENGLEFFEKKIRPLLSQHCYECHGSEEQEGSLRLDSRRSILKGGDTGPAIVPEHPEKSELVAALQHDPEGYQMPPDGKLSEEVIALFTDWVKRGAPWPEETGTPGGETEVEFNLAERAKHWSFQPVERPELPTLQNRNWPKQPLDHFILHKLEEANLTPAKETDKRTWLRRVSFDLVGLPPTQEEIQRFLTDDSEQAYEKAVDQLLVSPQYGVRWGRHWLDLVRFSETYGHEFDYNIPFAWRYRDYVIRALNQDLPYDQFVKEHIAGDLVQNPRRDPKTGNNESAVGTAFYWLGQGKHSPVDIRAEECDTVDNQIDVLSKTFLGLTVSCARCHDHKFDPITARDYYALAGFLQSSRQEWRVINDTPEVQDKLKQLHHLSGDEGQSITKQLLESAWDQLQASDSALKQSIEQTISSLDKQKKRLPADLSEQTCFYPNTTTTWLRSGWAFPIESHRGEVVLADESEDAWRITNGSTLRSGQYGKQLQGTLRSNTFTIKQKYIHYSVRRTGPDKSSDRGFKEGHLNLIVDGFQIIKRPLYGQLSLKIPNDGKQHWIKQEVSKFQESNAYIEILDEDDGIIEVDSIIFSDKPELPISEDMNDLPNYPLILATLQKYLKTPSELNGYEYQLLNMILESLNLSLPDQLKERITQFRLKVNQIRQTLPDPQRSIAIVEGTAENEHVLVRGNHNKMGEMVPRRFLEVFQSDQIDEQEKGSGRLQLAEQIASPDNPFTARVIVNRIWMHYFGRGIVVTPDNLGLLGQLPTHPELLDYLAADLVKNGWSLKELHKKLVLSRTYRMTSDLSDTKTEEVDPGNQLWHRMPLKRLEGEIVRDAVLAISGEIDETLYGPGVAPYLTPFMEGRGRPKQSGPLDGNGRRSIFLNVRRNFINPLFLAFDYPTPMTTTGRRSVSNVPAQALTMMNNPFVVEQAAIWMQKTGGKASAFNQEERIQQMYQRAFARPALPNEVEQGKIFLALQREEYSGEDQQELKAWNDYAHVLFNLKEFIYIR